LQIITSFFSHFFTVLGISSCPASMPASRFITFLIALRQHSAPLRMPQPFQEPRFGRQSYDCFFQIFAWLRQRRPSRRGRDISRTPPPDFTPAIHFFFARFFRFDVLRHCFHFSPPITTLHFTPIAAVSDDSQTGRLLIASVYYAISLSRVSD